MKIAIVGAGTIVPPFLNAARLVENMEIEAVCATSISEKLLNLQEKYQIEKVFDDYDTMLNNVSATTVYVAVPNHLHYIMAKKALLKGMNVILEKPFTVTKEEAVELFEIAEEKECFLFEAITTLHCPNYLKMKECLKEMPVIKIAFCNYTQYSKRWDAFKRGEILPAFDVTKNGGALRDINIYNVHFIVGLFGKPQQVHYYPHMERGVDTSGTLILYYGDFSCTLIGSKDCASNAFIRIQGEKQAIVSTSTSGGDLAFDYINDQEVTHYNEWNSKERMYYELVEFVRMVEENDKEAYRYYKQHTLDVMDVVDLAFASI